MAVADYPDGVGTAGPYINKLIDEPIEYETIEYEYEDGGMDVNVQPCGVRRHILEYEGLTQTDIGTIRTHYNLAKGMTEEFEFYHRRDATTYSGVHYESFEVPPHTKHWLERARVVLQRLV